MPISFAGTIGTTEFYYDRNASPREALFQAYERVIVDSIITSFGLDFLFMNDQYGGDVDTIHNVRNPDVGFKNPDNLRDYQNRGEYNSTLYHKHPNYIQTNRGIKQDKLNDSCIDAYTRRKLGRHDRTNLDHMISAKEINEDKGRVLAGAKGPDLANSVFNLYVTNEHTNKSKNRWSMTEYLNKHGNEYTADERSRMLYLDKKARQAYNTTLAVKYYTSPKFISDTTKAAGNVGFRMGCKQVIGLVFMEIWLAVKEEFQKLRTGFEPKILLETLGKGIHNGFYRAKTKWRTLYEKFVRTSVAGAMSSLTTTICNIFFTTARNSVRIIRQIWSSLVETANILFFNPQDLALGDQLHAVAKILSVGASVVVGSLVCSAISKTPAALVPVVGSIIPDFCGAFVTGIMSCTLLYVLDRSNAIQRLRAKLNQVDFGSASLAYFKGQARLFQDYAAQLERIDIGAFKAEVQCYEKAVSQLRPGMSDRELNQALHRIMKSSGIKLPWEGDFDTFMSNPKNRLTFS